MSDEKDTSTPDALDEQLLSSSVINWTARNAVEGVQIFGGIGSGKTTGSGRTLAIKYLKAGYGGLVLTVKQDEKDLWEEYCAVAGRTNDLRIIEEKGKWTFDFLDYEASKQAEKRLTDNIVQVLKTVIRAGESKGQSRSDDSFWEDALDMLLHNAIDLCRFANNGKITVEKLYEVANTFPRGETYNHRDFVRNCKEVADAAIRKNLDTSNEEASDFNSAYQKVITSIRWRHFEKWQKLSNDEQMQLDLNPRLHDQWIAKEVPEAKQIAYLDKFVIDFATMSDKTRAIVDFSLSGLLFRLLREPTVSLLCSQTTTVTPDDCIEGKIILINLPVKLFHKVGRDAQLLFKYIWQRAMERRKIVKSTKPVFLWADEAQNFLHEHDADFQATARSSRVATVYISQNLPNYHASMGGNHSTYKVQSFLGTLATKIFHANADIETNKYASDLIGEGLYNDPSISESTGKGFSETQTKSFKYIKIVRPEAFVRLRTGTKANDKKVDAYIHKQGLPFPNGQNHTLITFKQETDNN